MIFLFDNNYPNSNFGAGGRRNRKSLAFQFPETLGERQSPPRLPRDITVGNGTGSGIEVTIERRG